MSGWKMVTGAALLIAGLACGGVGGGGFENQDACKKWMEKQNGLKCMKDAKVDADQACPAALDMSPLDMTEYYDCMAKGAKCKGKGKIPDLGGQAKCTMPTP